MRYAISLMASLMAVLGVVFTFNWYLDPFGYWGRFPIGVYTDGYAREMKAAMVQTYPHETTLIGASTGMQIDPDAIARCKVYNASINGIRAEQIYHLIANFVPRDKFVVIGLDFFTFRDDDRRSTSFGRRSFANVVNYTLSTEAVLRSLNAIKQLRKGWPASLKRNGARPTDELLRADAKLAAPDYTKYLGIAEKYMFNDFELSEERFRILRETRALLDQRGQAYAFYITPTSAPMLAFLERLGLTSRFDEFRRRLKEIVPDIRDFTEPRLEAPSLYYKSDPLHFLPSTGAQIVDELLADRGCDGRGGKSTLKD